MKIKFPNRPSSVVNRQSIAVLLALGMLFATGCSDNRKKPAPVTAAFPAAMVGTWEGYYSPLPEQKWQFTFESDGSISKLYHHVFGPLIVAEGGRYVEGPDPNSYMTCTFSPIELNYDAAKGMIEFEIVIDDWEMHFPGAGTLKGRMIDNFIGPVTSDGKTWHVDWRSYGWLEGADEPPIDVIDANPTKLVLVKVESVQ